MGRAHHTHHLVWCEAARTAWLEERGASYAELEARGVFLPVSRVAVDYRNPVGYDEEVLVVTRLSAVRSRSVTFTYSLRRASDDSLVARVETDLICVDDRGAVRRLPRDLRGLLEGEAEFGDVGEKP